MPLVAFILLSQLTGENYPFSRYAMYSNPSAEPLSFQFIADETGTPVPTKKVLGISSTSLMKVISGSQGRMAKAERAEAAKEGRAERSSLELRKMAAEQLLDYVQNHAAGKKRKAGPLPEHLKVIETTVAVKDGKLTESFEVLAERQP